MHFLGGFFGVNLIIGVIVACGYYAGGPAVQALLNVIPEWISNGLQITMGLLPAIGFGLLLMMIMDKEKKNYGKVSMGVVRTTYLIDEQGIIIKANDKVKAADDPENMLKELA